MTHQINEVLEAGIVLLGPEVKSLREGRANLVDSYAKVKRGEVFLHACMSILTPSAHHVPLDPLRDSGNPPGKGNPSA